MEDFVKYIIEKEDTDIYGLKYKPSVVGYTFRNGAKIYAVDNTIDGISHCFAGTFNEKKHMGELKPGMEFSIEDKKLLKSVIIESKPKTIVEIGVHRSLGGTSTMVILNNKVDNCIYLGIDIESKTELNNGDKLIYTIKSPSQNYDITYKYMEEIGINIIDLLHIDGRHDVIQVTMN